MVHLEGAERLTRASLALRGVRPSLDEYERLAADPTAFEALVGEYAASDAFTETALRWTNEVFLVQTETIPLPPSVGALAGYTQAEVYTSATSEPLALVAHLLDNDLPFTGIVTADYVLADPIVAAMWGLPYDEAGPTWQVTHFTDGRPPAGLLTSPWMQVRYQSAGNNFHRARADMLADTLLCESFNTRDVVVAGDLNISDEAEVAEAVATNPECIGCHQAMDPLAGYFWGYKGVIRRSQIHRAHEVHDCYWAYRDGEPLPPDFDSDVADYCYPLRQYFPELETEWVDLGLRAPSYYSEPATNLTEVGQKIADDPRFSRCMSERLFAYLAQARIEDLPPDTVSALQQTFETSNFDLRALAGAIATTEAFAAAGANDPSAETSLTRLRPVRPAQFASALYDLTGYRWHVDTDAVTQPDCNYGSAGNTCWGTVDLLTNELFGFYSMQGGIDAYYTVRPEHTISPTKLLTTQRVSWDAARWVVEQDLAAGATPRLLDTVTATTVDEGAIRDQLVRLCLRVHGRELDAGHEDITLLYELFDASRADGDPLDAWTVVLAAMLQDPATLLF